LDSGENIGVAKVRRADWNTDVVVALNASLGLTLKRSKGGALVAEVQPGGPAERAGVKVGLLATHLNGLQLDSISQGTFLEVIGSISGKSTLTTLELGDFVLQP
jgi:S1-C subfamily serine protease